MHETHTVHDMHAELASSSMNCTVARRISNRDLNKLHIEDQAIHNWYRFVLSFPPHLVRTYIAHFGVEQNQCVLDPFSGTGTVAVECKRLGISSVGIEANPMAHFASQVKLDWLPTPDGLVSHAEEVAHAATVLLQADGIEDTPSPCAIANLSLKALPAERKELLLKNSISPLPLHKTLVLLECLEKLRNDQYYRHELLAIAKSAVQVISNLHFGPEVGIGVIKPDAPVIATWLTNIRSMADDLYQTQFSRAASTIHLGDARRLPKLLSEQSIDAVITSPPYPNEKDYTRATRLESVLLGFIKDKSELQLLKRGLLCSNTRNVYKGDDDDLWVADQQDVQRVAKDIELRRVQLGKTSGFERLYAKVTKLYFGGMARHLASLRMVLRPGAQLAYVMGDQASYLRVMIPTGQLVAAIAESLGYRVTGIDLFRTRLSTATRQQLREEVVLLQWPGTTYVKQRFV